MRASSILGSLTENEEQSGDVVCNGCLNHRVVDAVNQLLGSQLGGQPQSMLMSQSLSGFAVQHQDTVMILHAPNRWVTVAAAEGEIIYVDSLRPHQQIIPYVTRQLLQLFPQHIGGDGKLTN